MPTSLVLTRDQAIGLVDKLIQNRGLRNHMLAVEACMRGLWGHFSQERSSEVEETQDVWGLLGLLHDADWEQTESSPHSHTVVTSQELEKLGVPDWFSDALRSHNFDHLESQRQPVSLMEWSLYACDHMSGIIVACALVSPDKQLANVPLERVMKKFKEKSFAKGATREEILTGIEHLRIPLEKLAAICLQSLKGQATVLGL